MVVGPGEAVKAGGFLTGWKGIAIFITVGTVAAVMAITGIQASKNTFPRLSTAEAEFSSSDYGLGPLYAPCITNGSFIGQRWVYDLPVPGRDPIEVVDLGDRELLSRLSGGGIDSSVRWNNNPEFVCFVICRIALGDECTYFTYDGLDADSCRFGAPDFPMEEIQPAEPEDFLFVYNATCMQRRRELLVAPIEVPATGLQRPNDKRPLGNEDESARLKESLQDNLSFLRGQWAGPLPPMVEYVEGGGYTWREPGFTELADSCGEEDVQGSFATGDHVVVTMATANQVATMSLSFVWWRETIGQLGSAVLRAVRDELLRGSAYLIRAWEPGRNDAGRVMLGVGDQLDLSGLPEMYQDFGTAPFALQIGNPPVRFAQPLRVNPECTYTANDRPEPATAAHMAAALALGSIAVNVLSLAGDLNPTTMLKVAEELYQYSITNMPFDATEPAFPSFNSSSEYGASQLYPLDEDNDLQVFSHQLWAACSLYQATGSARYWNDTLEIYDRYFDALDSELIGSPLYTPAANYRNPQWYGLLCMAQSSPEASNIAEDPLLAVPEHVNPAAEVEVNETAAGWRSGQREQYRQYLNAQLPETGTRMEVMRQISNNFIYPWLTLQSQAPSRPGADPTFEENDRLRRTDADRFHYFDLNGDDEAVVGTATVVRDSSAAAIVQLMFADMPGVDEEQAFQARCMAKQQVDFILGENTGQTTLQAFFGEGTTVQNFWHKDSACPPESVRNATFLPIFTENPNFDPNETVSVVNRVSLSPRRCDYLTFFGNLTDPEDFPDFIKARGDDLPAQLDPVRPNDNNLVGALAATFDVTGDSGSFFVDQRAICKNGDIDISTCPRADDQAANPMTQVSIDTNAAFFGAVAGVIALPAEFWDRIEECPSPGDRVSEGQDIRDAAIDEDAQAISSDFIAEATADPNLTVQGPDNGLRVPRRSSVPAPVDDDAGPNVDEDEADDAADAAAPADDDAEDDEDEGRR
eukprot:jgi/Ulvmu1/6840/UM031_0045.1